MSQKTGDPEGRRLARHRAQLLAEAARVARVLKVLAERAGYEDEGIEAAEKGLAREEQNMLVRGRGRLEPRTRYKQRTGQPLLEDREINLLFADESGMPGHQPHEQDDCFAVGAVAMDTGQEATYKVAADRLKMEFFGTTDITFHEPEMREHEGRYAFDGDRDRQVAFDAAVNGLVEKSDFVVFGAGIRKNAFAAEFLEAGLDPYLPFDVYALAIHLLLERYVDFLNERPRPTTGRATFESQGPREDAIHQREYIEVLMRGTQWVPPSAFRGLLEPGLRFTKKNGSDAMELADMVSRDLFEWIRDGCAAQPLRWGLLTRKIYRRGDMAMGKFGVKVFPDSGIRHLIEEHRRAAAEDE